MRRTEQPQVEMQIAPLIDVCFLLLFFYILTSKPVQPEADLGVNLPGTVSQEETLELPDEQRVEILESGHIVLNEEILEPPESTELPRLRAVLARYEESTRANKAKALITLDAADQARHQRIIDVLNVCAQVGITQVTFAGAQGDAP
ncbi:MAG: biopolymer transport protein ExbD [Verrucomicrobia bacterium]|nr:MAG: biopolymer transport protein ExbD [Verrucomicrobiota bacterium]